MSSHMLQADRLHIRNKRILPVLGEHVIDFLLTPVPELCTNQRGITLFTVWADSAEGPVLRQREHINRNRWSLVLLSCLLDWSGTSARGLALQLLTRSTT